MRTALAIALGLVSTAALAQASQPGSPPSMSPGGVASTPVVTTPVVSPDAGPPAGSSQGPSDAGPAARTPRTGDQPATEPAARIYSFDPLPIGSYSFESPPSTSSASTTSQSGPSSAPR